MFRSATADPTPHAASAESPSGKAVIAVALCGSVLALAPFVSTPAGAQQVPTDFTGIVEQMSPSVVAITTRRVVERERAQVDPQQLPPPLRDFFGRRGEMMPGMPGVPGMPEMQTPQQPRQARALGSGFFVSADGYIVTNNHVIAEADEIQVMFGDGETRSAELVGADPATDLAVLRIDPDMEVTVAPWGDSDAMQPGAWTIAIGSPFGLGGTVTVGVLSARSRDIRTGPYDDFLQTDAAINRGNSGGPLFNGAGEVIGVNTAIFSPTGASVGIGFAVPSRTAMRVVEQLIETGVVERGFLGVRLQEMTPALARAFGIDDEQGAVVVSVEPDSPAQAAGLTAGDVILRFADEPVEGSRELSRVVAEVTPGTQVPVTVRREGEDMQIDITVGVRVPEEPPRTGAIPEPEDAVLGLALSPLPEVMQRQLGLDPDTQAAVVQRVEPGGPAAEAGMLQGDVIVQVDNRPLAGPGDVSTAWRTAREEERPLLMRVLRNGNPLFVAIEPVG
jgi:serine protease Do